MKNRLYTALSILVTLTLLMSGEMKITGASNVSNRHITMDHTRDAEPVRLAAQGDDVQIVRVCPIPLTKLEAGQLYSFAAIVDYTLTSRSSATLEFAVYQFGEAAGTTGRIASASRVVSQGSGRENLVVDIVAPNDAEAIRVVANLRVDAQTLVRGGLFSDPYPLVEGTSLYFGNCLRRIPPNHLAVGEEVTSAAGIPVISPAGGSASVAPQAIHLVAVAPILKLAIHLLGHIAVHILLLEAELVGDVNPALVIEPNVLDSVSGSIGPNQRLSVGVVEVGARNREHLVSIDIHANLPEEAQVILYDPEGREYRTTDSDVADLAFRDYLILLNPVKGEWSVFVDSGTTGGDYVVYVAQHESDSELCEDSTFQLDGALVIDSSGSMKSNDPQDQRKEAGKVFIGAMENGDQIAVIDFDSETRVAWPLQPLGDDRSGPEAAVDTIDSSGGTNIGAGLQTGFNELDSSTAENPKAAVLLTDGVGGYSGQAAQYAEKGWQIYTIGLGTGPDEDLLRQIASETCGQYYALSDPDQLIDVYFKILGAAASAPTISAQTITVQQGETSTVQTSVPVPAPATANFLTMWPGSTVDVTLTDPDGHLITPGVANQDPDIYHSKGTSFELYRITFPKPGDWEIEIFGADLPSGGEEVTVEVSVRGEKTAVFLPLVLRDYTPSCITPPPGLVAWWPGDAHADDVVGDNDGMLRNGAGFAEGKVDQAFELDGVNDYVSIQGNAALSPPSFSYAFWLNPQQQICGAEGAFCRIIDRGYESYFAVAIKRGSPMLWVRARGSYEWTDTRYAVAENAWTHIVLTYHVADSDTQTLIVYANGQEVYRMATTNPVAPPDNILYIGRRIVAGGENYLGLIDEVSFFDRALSPTQVQAIFSAGSAGMCK